MMSITHKSVTRWIPVGEMMFVTGTWTDQVNSNVWSKIKADADETATIRIPISLPILSDHNYKGCYLKSLTIQYSVADAAMDALAVVMYKQTLAVHGAAPATASVTVTYDSDHDTGAERLAIDDHTLTLTLTTPVWIDDGELFFAEMSANAAATSNIVINDAMATFDLQL